MQSYLYILLLGYAAVVSAHFQLQFPPPRGVFVQNNEPTFCDGYTTVTTNRTQFPLTNGFFTLNSEHPTWTSGVILSTAANPTSFNNFSQVKPFFRLQGEGVFCIPLDLASSANATNLRDGQNVTIQIVFDGGDSTLYQCADLTLSSSLQISSNVSCTNATATTSTATAASSTPTKAGAIGRSHTMGYAGLLLSVTVVVFSIL